MNTNLSRLVILLACLALSVGSVFAQEEAPVALNSFTAVLVIIGIGVVAVAALGFAMREPNNNGDKKSE